MPIFSRVIGSKFTNKSSANVNLRCWMSFGSDALFTKIPNSMNLGIASVLTSDKLRSVFIPTTRIGTPTDGSNLLLTIHIIGEVKSNRVSTIRSGRDYNVKKMLKLEGKIKILGAKIFLWVDHLWTLILLVRTLPTEKHHLLTQFQPEQKLQSLCH